MLIGHFTGDANGPNGMRFSSNAERVAFFFFPVCTIVGLALAYKWAGAGGSVTVLSLVGLFSLRPDLLFTPFLALVVPGLLYVLCGMMGRKRMA